MEPVTIAAGITALAAAGSAIYKNYQDKKRYKQELQDMRDNWKMQNDYNSPSSQMARLKSAGLNPNLVYQQGGAQSASGEMSNPSFADAPLFDYQAPVQMAIQADSANAAIEEAKARTRKTNAEAYDLEEHNKELDRTMGALKDYSLLSNEEHEYYAQLFGVDPNSVNDLSVRGASILNDLNSKFKNNKILDETYWKVFHESSKAEKDAALSKLAVLFETMNLQTEASKRGWNVNYYGGYVNGERQNWVNSIYNDPSKVDKVLEMFLRELKEVHWQSSDAKHIIDSTNQSISSIGNVIPKFHKGMFSDKYRKDNYKSKSKF